MVAGAASASSSGSASSPSARPAASSSTAPAAASTSSSSCFPLSPAQFEALYRCLELSSSISNSAESASHSSGASVQSSSSAAAAGGSATSVESNAVLSFRAGEIRLGATIDACDVPLDPSELHSAIRAISSMAVPVRGLRIQIADSIDQATIELFARLSQLQFLAIDSKSSRVPAEQLGEIVRRLPRLVTLQCYPCPLQNLLHRRVSFSAFF